MYYAELGKPYMFLRQEVSNRKGMKRHRGQTKRIKSERRFCNENGQGFKICPAPKGCRLIRWYFLAGKDGKPMNFSTSTTDKTERLKDTKSLANQWETIDWSKVENEVNRLQTRIAKATADGDRNKAKRLQYLLTHSFSAKALAVKKVTTNKGKRTSGVDKKLWSTSATKMKAVFTLRNC